MASIIVAQAEHAQTWAATPLSSGVASMLAGGMIRPTVTAARDVTHPYMHTDVGLHICIYTHTPI
eukprot:4504-Pleurochrysis_carterae.AAC.1